MAHTYSGSGGFLRSLSIQMRTVGALIMREILTRYGRHNIGFMWLFVEPMMFTAGVVVVRVLLHLESARVPLIPFVVTGYSTILLWRNGIGRCGNAIEPNRSLLHHRNVRVFDLFIARLVLEVAGATISLVTLSSVLIAVGAMLVPDDIFKMAAAWVLLAWFAMAMGLLIGGLATTWEPVDRIWHVIAYLFLPLSGAFFMVSWLPSAVQNAAVYIPTVSCIELMREGYFGPSMQAHYNIGFVAMLNVALTLAGLAVVTTLPKKVEGE
jgi:capsular polysaccharide transport system permease protein